MRLSILLSHRLLSHRLRPFLFRPLLFLTALFSIVLSGCNSTSLGEVTEEVARENLGVSILVVNLYDILNAADEQNPHVRFGTDWQTRYTRIFIWMRDTQTFPDIIALQEAPAFWSCPTNGRMLPDYAAIDFLLDGIRDVSGEQYRIAYLIAGKPGNSSGDAWVGSWPAGACSTQGGRALLYRPSKIKNVITAPGVNDTVISPYETPYPMNQTYLARSVQCCSPAADRSDVCNLIDGPLVEPSPGHFELTMGTCPTPLGVAWTRSRVSMQGSDPSKPAMDAVFSRLELVKQPGNFIHIYNVHKGTEGDESALPPNRNGSENMDQLVTDMEAKFSSPHNITLYPPILVGDFNIGLHKAPPSVEEVKGHLPRFDIAMWSPEVMGALFGSANIFPSKQKAYANLQQVIPATANNEACYRDRGTLWSDHCGIYFRVEPSPSPRS